MALISSYASYACDRNNIIATWGLYIICFHLINGGPNWTLKKLTATLTQMLEGTNNNHQQPLASQKKY
jgi:hypothetical protein